MRVDWDDIFYKEYYWFCQDGDAGNYYMKRYLTKLKKQGFEE